MRDIRPMWMKTLEEWDWQDRFFAGAMVFFTVFGFGIGITMS